MKYSDLNFILKGIILGVVLWLSTTPLMPQTNTDGTSPQYLYQEFSQSVVKFKNGKSQKYMMNYNMVTEMMVFEKDDKRIDLTNVETIDTIFMQNSKFVPIGKVFYEVVLIAPISLFIQYKGKIMPPGQPTAYGGTSQTSSIHTYSGINTGAGYYNFKLPSDFIVKIEPVYWIRKNYEMFSFMTKNQFLKIFPDKAVKIKQNIRLNRIKINNRNQLIKLIIYCNELYPK